LLEIARSIKFYEKNTNSHTGIVVLIRAGQVR